MHFLAYMLTVKRPSQHRDFCSHDICAHDTASSTTYKSPGVRSASVARPDRDYVVMVGSTGAAVLKIHFSFTSGSRHENTRGGPCDRAASGPHQRHGSQAWGDGSQSGDFPDTDALNGDLCRWNASTRCPASALTLV